MFAIRLFPASKLGPDGQRLGEITIGKFREVFACHSVRESFEEMADSWRSSLQSLLAGETPVALVHDPRFAWVIYREGSRCFIQQKFSLNADFHVISSRQTKTEDGERVSEWITDISDIECFMRS